MHVASHSSNYGYSADLDQFDKRNGKNSLLCSSFFKRVFAWGREILGFVCFSFWWKEWVALRWGT
jgi:hypothetical protein